MYQITSGETANGLAVVRLSKLDDNGVSHVDSYRTPSAARHAITLLESGAAVVKPHALPGCRVQPCEQPEGYATDGTRGGSFLKPY